VAGRCRPNAPVHRHDIGVAGRDQRVGKRHPGRARPDDQIVGLDPAHGRILRSLRTIRAAGFGEVLRGVSFTPRSR